MSSSPRQEDPPAENLEDEVEEVEQQTTEGAPEVSDSVPVKRGRGRPKGSKNKKSGSAVAAGAAAPPAIPRKRGRPPKEKKADESGAEGEPSAKRSRGRPPKAPKPVSSDNGAATATSDSAKAKKGRPVSKKIGA